MIIKTFKYHNENGAKITATSKASQNAMRKTFRATVDYDYALNGEANHKAAALKLANRFDLDSIEQTGSHKTGLSFIA